MKKIICMLVTAMMVFMLASCGSNQETSQTETSDSGDYEWTQDYEWKFTHEGSPGMGEEHFANTFVDLINEKSDGHIHVTVYDFNQLGSGADQFELIQNGAVDFGIAGAGAIASLVPEAGIFGLHYIFPEDMSEMWDFMANSEACDYLSEVMNENGFHVFSWNTQGPHVWTMKKEISSVDDMKGIKFRTQANQLEMASFRAYGADATTVAFAELYSALQLGTVDGQQQSAQGNNVMHYYEVAPYYIDAHASYYVDAPVCNSELYDSLDPYVQDLVTECMLEARDSLEEFCEVEQGTKAREEAEANGATWIELSEEQQEGFAEKAVAVRDTYLEIGGDNAQKVLDMMLKELGK